MRTYTSAQDRIREAGFSFPFQGKKAKGQNTWNNRFHITGHQVMKGYNPWEKKETKAITPTTVPA